MVLCWVTKWCSQWKAIATRDSKWEPTLIREHSVEAGWLSTGPLSLGLIIVHIAFEYYSTVCPPARPQNHLKRVGNDVVKALNNSPHETVIIQPLEYFNKEVFTEIWQKLKRVSGHGGQFVSSIVSPHAAWLYYVPREGWYIYIWDLNMYVSLC